MDDAGEVLLRPQIKVNEAERYLTVNTFATQVLPGIYDWFAPVGADTSLQFVWQAQGQRATVSCDGGTASLEIRRTAGEASPILTLTHAAGIALSDETPNVTVTLTEAQLETLVAHRRLLMDLVVNAPGNEVLRITGTLTVARG